MFPIMEEEEAQNRASSASHSPLTNSHTIDPSSSSSSSPVSQAPETEQTEVNIQQEEDHQQLNNGSTRDGRRRNPRRGFGLRIRGFISYLRSNQEWNDSWSCLVVLLTFCSFASMTLILGFYGSFSVELGPNSSYLIDATPIFVRYVKAEETDDTTAGPILYGFHKSPSLDVKTTWSQYHNASIVSYLYKEWTYYLNEGSRIEISYDVRYPSSVPLFLVVAEGRESLLKWIEDPSYPNTTLSWKIIYGVGTLGQDISTSDTYYVAVGNLNSDTTVVHLNVTIHSVLYNTSNARFKCSLSNHICKFRLHLFKPNSALLTTPSPTQANADEDWYIEVSFVAQWITYVCGTGIITVLVLTAFRLCNWCQSSRDGAMNGTRNNGEHREPLLSPKDDDRSSWGSSYDSIPYVDDEDLEEKLLESYPGGGKVDGEAKTTNNFRGLCVVCFDAPRDCFFLPCGHCATCFPCGSRIAEEAGICPICRRKMKKVRKIFAV